MMPGSATSAETSSLPAVIDLEGLRCLLDGLMRRGYTVVGPTVAGGAIVHDELTSVDDLPRGWTDDQQPGRYRLTRRDDDALFGYAVGPHSPKRYLLPPSHRLWAGERTEAGQALLPLTPGDARRRRRRGRRHRPGGAAHGPDTGHHRHQGAAVPQPGAPAMG
jgi:hypothetical protein